MVLLHRAALSLCTLSILAACVPTAPTGEAGADAQADTTAKPELVCKQVREIAAKDSDDAETLDQVQRECVETVGKLATRYQTFTTCIDLAGNAAAVLQCEEALAKPRSLLAAASPKAKLEALCDHMLGLVKVKLGETVNNMTPQEFEQLREKCVTEAGAQIEVKGAEQFNKEADCILASQSLEEIKACKL